MPKAALIMRPLGVPDGKRVGSSGAMHDTICAWAAAEGRAAIMTLQQSWFEVMSMLTVTTEGCEHFQSLNCQ